MKLTPEVKKSLIETITTFLMSFHHASDYSEVQANAYYMGFLQAVKTAFGEAAEAEIIAEVREGSVL